MKNGFLAISIFLLFSNISWGAEDVIDLNYRPTENRKNYSFNSLGLSYTKFPREEMKKFISLDTQAQLKMLNRLGIKIYKNSIKEKRDRVNRKIDVIKS